MDEHEQCELVALCWIGRGDFSPEEWKSAVASEEPTPRFDSRLFDWHPLVSDHLEEGSQSSICPARVLKRSSLSSMTVQEL